MAHALAAQLLDQCEAARRGGDDFPTIWNGLLRRHPLVAGLPRHAVVGGETLIVVRLVTGDELVSSTRGFRLGG